MARDPVCGMTVDPATAAAHVEHRGETYYFCAKGCAHRFSATPEQYLQAVPAPVAESSSHAQHRVSIPGVTPQQKTIRYTCPMHPEVLQWGPSTCPKCGMGLEPAAVVAAA